VYNPNCLEWHQGERQKVENPAGYCVVLSCSKRFGFFNLLTNRLAAALAKSQDHRASCGVFSFGRPSDSRYVTDPAWDAKSENTDTATHPAACRPALIERLVKDWVQRWNKAQSISESIRQAHLVVFVILRCFEINFEEYCDEQDNGERWYIHPWRTYA
jgi:Ni/Co efflux regulator RcnB